MVDITMNLVFSNFDVVKIRKGKQRKKGKRYSKTKDGPILIGLLNLEILMQDFDEAKRLIEYIKKMKKGQA